MADVENKDVSPAETEKEVEKVEKKTVEPAEAEQAEATPEAENEESNDSAAPKENGDSAKNGKETNGVSEVTSNKRKSGAGEPEAVTDGTPEKKAKVAAPVEESEESNGTNGSTEVAA